MGYAIPFIPRLAIAILGLLVATMAANRIVYANEKVLHSPHAYFEDQGYLAYSLRLEGSETDIWFKEFGVIWQPYDPETGELLDQADTAHHYKHSSSIEDDSCSTFSCSETRTIATIRALPEGHYVMQGLFLLRDTFIEGTNFIGDKTNVNDLALPRVAVKKGEHRYIGDYLISMKKDGRRSFVAGILPVDFQGFEYGLKQITLDIEKFKALLNNPDSDPVGGSHFGSKPFFHGYVAVVKDVGLLNAAQLAPLIRE